MAVWKKLSVVTICLIVVLGIVGFALKSSGISVFSADTTADYFETFTISAESDGDSVLMVLEWERTRVVVGVKAVEQ
jgi:hypothetical protein